MEMKGIHWTAAGTLAGIPKRVTKFSRGGGGCVPCSHESCYTPGPGVDLADTRECRPYRQLTNEQLTQLIKSYRVTEPCLKYPRSIIAQTTGSRRRLSFFISFLLNFPTNSKFRIYNISLIHTVSSFFFVRYPRRRVYFETFHQPVYRERLLHSFSRAKKAEIVSRRYVGGMGARASKRE